MEQSDDGPRSTRKPKSGAQGPEPIKCCQWNCEGIASMMTLLAPADFKEFDLVLLTETFAMQRFDVEGFYAHHCLAIKPPHGRPYGGVSLLVGSALKIPRVVLSEDDTIVLISQSFTFIGMYSSGGRDSTEDLCEKIGRAMAQAPIDQPVLLAGDLNCRLDEHPFSTRTSALMSALEEHGLWLCSDPGTPTYYADSCGPGTAPRRPGSSTIDIFAFRGRPETVEFRGYPQTSSMMGLRKHLPVVISIKSQVRLKSTPRPGLSKKINPHHLLELIVKRDPREIERMPAEELSVCLTRILIDATRPRVVSQRKSQPWFDSACFETRRELMTLLRASPGCDDAKRSYSELRCFYRQLLVVKKENFAEEEERKMIMRAQETPYTYLRRPVAFQSCPIPAEQLQEHFRTMFQDSDTVPGHGVGSASEATIVPARSALELDILANCQRSLECPFTHDEVSQTISGLKNNKAFGGDLVRNEHLKDAVPLTPLWTLLFNRCLADGVVPRDWPNCILKVIPKGKGDPLSPSSWRGIAKKSCVYKTLAGMLANRLSTFLEITLALPDEQHGFRKFKSTATACAVLLEEIKLSLNTKGLPLFAAFVDLRAAFDVAPRDRVLEKLAALGVGGPFIGLLSSILQANRIILDDGIREHTPFLQTTGYPQGDNLSPILFLALLGDLPAEIKQLHPTVGIIMYADDVVLYSRIRRDLQASIRSLDRYCHNNGLEINESKTKAMKFRCGGRLAEHDKIMFRNSPIELVNNFSYLGVRFSTSGTCFSAHIAERVAKSVTAMSSIPSPQKLSLNTAMQLFQMKVGSVASYGVPLLWADLTARHMAKLDTVKATFLKRVLGLPRNTRNRLVYALAGTGPFVEDLVDQFNLGTTLALTEFRETFSKKMREVSQEFYQTAAMTDERWKGPLQDLRHLITRLATHGFHHELCTRRDFHAASDLCVCRYCDQPCPQYHFDICAVAPNLKQLAGC